MFKECFYWMYWYVSKINRESELQRFVSAYLVTSLVQGVNIGTLLMVLKQWLKLSLTLGSSRVEGCFLAGILFAINYFYLFRRREQIVLSFERESDERRRKGKRFFWLYLFLSLALFYAVGESQWTPKHPR